MYWQKRNAIPGLNYLDVTNRERNIFGKNEEDKIRTGEEDEREEVR